VSKEFRLHLPQEQDVRRIEITARDGIWIIDPDGRTVFVNERMAEILGTTVKAMQQHSSFDYLFPEDQEAARQKFEAKKDGDDQAFEFRLRRLDGSAVRTRIWSRPMYAFTGELHGIVGVFTELDS